MNKSSRWPMAGSSSRQTDHYHPAYQRKLGCNTQLSRIGSYPWAWKQMLLLPPPTPSPQVSKEIMTPIESPRGPQKKLFYFLSLVSPIVTLYTYTLTNRDDEKF
jgi:hypothetical protein